MERKRISEEQILAIRPPRTFRGDTPVLKGRRLNLFEFPKVKILRSAGMPVQ
jgi:hypothetical protein